jgi:hypothetical protein
MQYGLRMRVKSDHSAKQFPFRCSLLQFSQQVAMPGMDTVEYAYGEQSLP